MTTLAALEKVLERQLKQIERLESELFFKRIQLAGLKSAKDALLRELVVSDKEVRRGTWQSKADSLNSESHKGQNSDGEA